jgi:hypothetical protein
VSLQTIPIQAIPAQNFQAQLGSQDCDITLQQMSTGLFATVYVNGNLTISSRYCNDRVNLIRQTYLGFGGGLYFVDTAAGSTGESQPLTGTNAPGLWTADSDAVTADSSDFTADGSTSGTSQGVTNVPLGLDPYYTGLGSRFILVYEPYTP